MLFLILWHKNVQIAQSFLRVSGNLRFSFETFQICTNFLSVSSNFQHVSGNIDHTKKLYLFSTIWHNTFSDSYNFPACVWKFQACVREFPDFLKFRTHVRKFSARVRIFFDSKLRWILFVYHLPQKFWIAKNFQCVSGNFSLPTKIILFFLSYDPKTCYLATGVFLSLTEVLEGCNKGARGLLLRCWMVVI